ncbi:HEAT repeat domain-containing protein [Micromonospora sp. DT53]|uniref:HEAT repeat domain-containing protein n=1 Tax=Micromonospora sp. DT53 TaxID=3393444 RepID=UPI003CF666BF
MGDDERRRELTTRWEHNRERAIRTSIGNFGRALGMMRSRDPQLAEDGFGLLQAMAGQHVDELVDEFGRETDYSMRCWLLELIGDARSPPAFELLAAELLSDDESFSGRAERGLRALDTKDARRLLWQTGKNGPPAPEGALRAS